MAKTEEKPVLKQCCAHCRAVDSFALRKERQLNELIKSLAKHKVIPQQSAGRLLVL